MTSDPRALPRVTQALAAERASTERLVRALALTTFLLWLGASSILPLLPEYLRRRGGSDTTVGFVMAAYFVAALVCQYPAGRLADRVGRRRVLVGGLVVYAGGSLAFLGAPGPAFDIALRALQGAGAGSAEVAALAMIASSVALERRGRAFGSIYGAQLAGMAIGPLLGSVIGVGSMAVLFVVAGAGSLVACLPALGGAAVGDPVVMAAEQGSGGLPEVDRSLVGAVLAAAAFGLTIGVYESCWTLLLELRHAADWEIGLSWTLFAVPFVAMARPGGWLADHYDRRWLVVGGLSVSISLCALYPFVRALPWLMILGGVEALAVAVALPAAQSMLTQASRPSEAGRVQGLFSTAQTAAIAVAAGAGGGLFGLVAWAPFVAGAAGTGLLTAGVPLIWRSVPGHVGRAQAA